MTGLPTYPGASGPSSHSRLRPIGAADQPQSAGTSTVSPCHDSARQSDGTGSTATGGASPSGVDTRSPSTATAVTVAATASAAPPATQRARGGRYDGATRATAAGDVS